MAARKIQLHTEITFDDLVEDITDGMDDGNIIQLIKNIDLRVADYTFTKTLRDYFVKEIERSDKAINEDKKIVVSV